MVKLYIYFIFFLQWYTALATFQFSILNFHLKFGDGEMPMKNVKCKMGKLFVLS